jgi:SAM-dependent methyltransferase
MITAFKILIRSRREIRLQLKENEILKTNPFKNIGLELCPSNFGRALVLAQFLNCVPGLLQLKPEQSLKVAVIGGSSEEYELAALKNFGFKLDFQVFGIDGESTHLDLNIEDSNTRHSQWSFDLILCSQVLEHTWNIDAVFKNLAKFISPGVLIWVAAPASNRFHGSPEYYSAGYTEKFIEQNFEKLGFTTLHSGQIGTKRNYFATHLLPRWLSVRAHANPLFFSIGQGNFLANVFYMVNYLPWTLLLTMTSPRITSDPRFATESWFLGTQKPS